MYHDQNENDQNYDTYHILNAKKRTLDGYNGDDYIEDSGGEWSRKNIKNFETGRSTGRARIVKGE